MKNRSLLIAASGLFCVWGLAPSSALAQGSVSPVSLGGYGAMSGGSGSSMGGGSIIVDSGGMGGNVLVPIGGGLGTSMEPSMKGAGLSFRSRPTAAMNTSRLSLSMDSMGGMSRMGGGMGGRRSFALQPGSSSNGMGSGGGMRRMSASGGMGVMPPNFGSPFRQPGSLFLPSSPGTGMGM